jgi:hypothetical protein
MARSRCPNCGAEIDIAQVVDNGNKTVALDLAVEPNPEGPAYVIVGHNPLRAVRAVRGGQPLHSFDCPGHNAGRRADERA